MTASPPQWCEDPEPSAEAYPLDTMQPDTGRPENSPPIQEPPLFLVGSTLVAPPPVLWLSDRPSHPSRVFGIGEAATFVKALELILPAGWTIWTSENVGRINRVVGDRVLWDGNGRPWPDVLETLAQQYGVEITADPVSGRAVVGLAASARVEAPGGAVQGAGQASAGDPRPPAPRTVPGEAEEARIDRSHPAYREFVTPTRLSVEPLPDTIGRIAWRIAPRGVQIDLAALGAYINAPVFQWDFGESFVTPQAALEALMPAGFCLDEGSFPVVIAAACDGATSAGKDAVSGESDEN